MDTKTITADNRQEIIDFMKKHWGSDFIISRGKRHDAKDLDGFIVHNDDKIVGLLTYHISGHDCEIVTLDSLEKGIGIASNLLINMKSKAKEKNCNRMWLISTNDNLDSIGFFQKRGFEMTKIYNDALDRSRQLKPQIPIIGMNGILLKHEIEFEMKL